MIREIATREIITRSRTKAYRITTVILLLAAIAGVIAVTIFDKEDDGTRDVSVGVVGELDQLDRAAIEAIGAANLTVTFLDLDDKAAGDLAIEDEEVDVVVENGSSLVWKARPDFELQAVINAAISRNDMAERATAAGLSPSDLQSVLSQEPLAERLIEPEDDASGVLLFVSMIGVVLTFLAIQAYGGMVLMGVVEEKSSGVIEVLLSHVRPRTLLAGKVIGIGLLAFVQLAIVLAALVGMLTVTTTFEIPAAAWRAIPLLAITVSLGFALYAVLSAAAGSLVSRQEDAQQVMLPIMIPAFVGYMYGFSGNPDSLLTKILSFVPLTAPFVLPMRSARGDIANWEIALSLALLVGAIVVVIRVAGRVYEYSLLRSGARVPWKEALGAARFARVTSSTPSNLVD